MSEPTKHTLERCSERGSTHKAYDWSPQQTYNTDDRGAILERYSEEQHRAYLEGYYGTEGGYGNERPALTGDALKTKVDERIAKLKQGWADEKEAQKASGRPASDFAPGGFGP